MEEKKQEKFDKEYAKNMMRQYMPLTAVVIVAAAGIIIFYFCVKRYAGLKAGVGTVASAFTPIMMGFVMAFLMNPVMDFLEKRMLPFFMSKTRRPEKTKKTVRLITSLCSMVFLWGIIILFVSVVIPQLYNTIVYLSEHLVEQIYGVLDWANEITEGKYQEAILGAKNDEKITSGINTGISYVRKYLDLTEQEDVVAMVTQLGYGIGKFIVNIIIGIFVSVYVLLEKEKFKAQTKKMIYGFFSAKTGNVIMEVLRKTNDVFYGFIIGKIIDSFIIGVICYVVMTIVGMPYAVLTSVIIGVTNIIPVFGPYIGAIPTVIIIFLTEPRMGIYFLIFVVILQQFDGNLIGPKILGDSTGLSSFWVVVAIVVGGSLFGFMGMLLGVPTMAMIYYLVGRLSGFLLRKRKLPDATGQYLELDHVDVATNRIVEKTQKIGEETKSVGRPKFFKKKTK